MIQVYTPYYKGEVEAQCLPDAFYDLIIGNIPGAREPDDPNPKWQEACAATTRAQARKSDKTQLLKTAKNLTCSALDKDQLITHQTEDLTLQKYFYTAFTDIQA